MMRFMALEEAITVLRNGLGFEGEERVKVGRMWAVVAGCPPAAGCQPASLCAGFCSKWARFGNLGGVVPCDGAGWIGKKVLINFLVG